MKAFLIDITKCVGCHDCQIGCKDEHCGQAWMPYAEAQPQVGQFWMKLNQTERGARPHVRVTYLPVMCQHCENAPCMKVAKDGAVYRRDDGLVIIDPVKAKGQKQIVDACPYHAVFWNEELNIPQKCTGCAHLLDGDEPHSGDRELAQQHDGQTPAGHSARRKTSTSRAPSTCMPSTAPSRACGTRACPRSSSRRRCSTPTPRRSSRARR